MAQSYCGKSCAECRSRYELDCPGCKYGPGTLSGGCSIAKCCIGQGHAVCDTCTKLPHCQTIKAKDIAPEIRLKRMAAQKAEKERLARRAPVLGTWLWVLFWAYIVNIATSVLLQTDWAYILAVILNFGVLITMTLSFWKLSSCSDYYKKAFYCCIGIIVLNAIVEALSNLLYANASTVLALICAFPVLVLNIVEIYFENQGHSEQLRPVDAAMADKWLNLWKWFIYAGAALCVSTLILAIFPVLGLFLFLPSCIGLLVVSIMRIKCLYDSAYIFHDIAAEYN